MPSLTTHAATEGLSALLRRQYGEMRAAAKQLARAASSNETSARNWLEGRNLPGFLATVELMRRDDEVFDWICRLADRDPNTPRLTETQRAALLKLLEDQ